MPVTAALAAIKLSVIVVNPRQIARCGSVPRHQSVSRAPSELGTLHRRQLAALAGVAPFNGDRGTYRGKRRLWGGRATLRAVLYRSTLSAVRCNPIIRAFYERLRSAGKAYTVAMIAWMRKLLTILNAIVKNHTPWQAESNCRA